MQRKILRCICVATYFFVCFCVCFQTQTQQHCENHLHLVEATIIEILRTLALTGFQASKIILSAQLSDRAKFHVISCHFRPAKTRKADFGFTEISHFLVEMTLFEPSSKPLKSRGSEIRNIACPLISPTIFKSM